MWFILKLNTVKFQAISQNSQHFPHCLVQTLFNLFVTSDPKITSLLSYINLP